MSLCAKNRRLSTGSSPRVLPAGLQPVPAAAVLLSFREERHGVNGTGVLENSNSRGEATLPETALRWVVLGVFIRCVSSHPLPMTLSGEVARSSRPTVSFPLSPPYAVILKVLPFPGV